MHIFIGFVRFYPFLDVFSNCEAAFFIENTEHIREVIRLIKQLPILNKEHTTQGSFRPFNSKEGIINPFNATPKLRTCRNLCVRVNIDNKDLIRVLFNEDFSLRFVNASEIMAYYRDLPIVS